MRPNRVGAERHGHNLFASLFTILLLLICGTLPGSAINSDIPGRSLRVNPVAGNDVEDGIAKPVRSIGRAIQLAQPGDTIHLQPMVYRDWAAFFDKSGDPENPITLDGHGATLNGCDPLDPHGGTEVEPELSRRSCFANRSCICGKMQRGVDIAVLTTSPPCVWIRGLSPAHRLQTSRRSPTAMSARAGNP